MNEQSNHNEGSHQPGNKGLIEFLLEGWVNWLLVFVLVSVGIYVAGLPKAWLFAVSAVAIIPLAGLIGNATEELAVHTGPGIGGLLNATFGNATELIISLFALSAGLFEVVKASISGSIIANLLLVLGTSMLAGGWRRQKQTFSRVHAGASASMLFLAVVALIMPAVFDIAVFGQLKRSAPEINQVSLWVCGVLILTYVASLVFSLRTHSTAVAGGGHAAEAELSVTNAIILLAIATALVAMESEFLVGAIDSATAATGMTQFFVGVVIVAIVGNAAEHYTAIEMAIKNKMDLAVTIATASSTQIALFVAPVLVFASYLFGHPMSLIFNAFEITGVTLAVISVAMVSLDGESNWFEGAELLAVYLVLIIVFYFAPGG